MGHLLQHSDEIVDTDFCAGITEEGGELGVEVLQMSISKCQGMGQGGAEEQTERRGRG